LRPRVYPPPSSPTMHSHNDPYICSR
jgi:hypothetical protein